MKAVFGKGERKEWKEDHQTFQKGEREKRGRKKRSSPQRFKKESMRAAKIGVGTCLFSRAASSQVSWAQVGLTAVFGMGTGGPSPQSAPTSYILTDSSAKINLYLLLP